MQKTLLSMVQEILDSVDSDNVNSISDTIESQTVTTIIKNVYEQFVAKTPQVAQFKLMPLTALSDINKPNYMKIPSHGKRVRNVRYDVREESSDDPLWKDITYKTPDEFLRIVQSNKPSLDEVIEITDYNGVKFYIYNDRAPTFYTSFDDTYLIFDSYNSSVDSTLQASKSSAIMEVSQSFEVADDFILPVEDNAFPFIQAEATATANAILNQTSNPKIEKQARDQMVYMQGQRHRMEMNDYKLRGPNYGRK